MTKQQQAGKVEISRALTLCVAAATLQVAATRCDDGARANILAVRSRIHFQAATNIAKHNASPEELKTLVSSNLGFTPLAVFVEMPHLAKIVVAEMEHARKILRAVSGARVSLNSHPEGIEVTVSYETVNLQ